MGPFVRVVKNYFQAVVFSKGRKGRKGAKISILPLSKMKKMLPLRNLCFTLKKQPSP